MPLSEELDMNKSFIVPEDEYLHYVSDATKYDLIRRAIARWENGDCGRDTLDTDALRYELILDLIDRWEHGKTGEFTRREGRESV